jgi:hypothetical protein
MGKSMGIDEDDFEINENSELVSSTPIDNDLARTGSNIIWNDGV